MSENQTDNNGLSSEPEKQDPPRDESGKFKPKKSTQNQSNPPPEPTNEKITPTNDALLDELEKDFTESLKGKVDLNDLEGLDQRTRIRMLRILAKNVGQSQIKDTINPMNPSPPSDDHIPTLAEINRSDKYRADMLKQGSYIGMTNKWRQGK